MKHYTMFNELKIVQSNQESKQELSDLLSDLKKQFKNRNCFLMPHPGSAVFKKDFDGNHASK